MGWTEYPATEWRKGRINRRAECRKYFEGNEQWGTLLKDAMVGSTWYGAVKLTSTGEVFGMIMLTSERDRYWFGYKEMDETCGPCHNDCPESILKLLSPTDNEFANKWRQACHERNERRKALNRAKVIQVMFPFDTTLCEANVPYELHRRKIQFKNRKDGPWLTKWSTKWYSKGEIYVTPKSLILKSEFTVIE